jgi:hypothetical protein
MTAQPGDLVVVESERVAHPVRRDVREKVLQQESRLASESVGTTAIPASSPPPQGSEDRGAKEGGKA